MTLCWIHFAITIFVEQSHFRCSQLECLSQTEASGQWALAFVLPALCYQFRLWQSLSSGVHGRSSMPILRLGGYDVSLYILADWWAHWVVYIWGSLVYLCFLSLSLLTLLNHFSLIYCTFSPQLIFPFLTICVLPSLFDYSLLSSDHNLFFVFLSHTKTTFRTDIPT